MMIGNSNHRRSNPTVHIPVWDHGYLEDPTAHVHSPVTTTFYGSPDGGEPAAMAALQRFLPSNADDDEGFEDFDIPVDAFSCDNFRMFEFKVKKCGIGSSHDWTACPFAHPGEKARRRDPRKYHYSGSACPDFRKGGCRRGDACEYAHGVFECWLHPARYRTQPCKDGTHCRRRVCFFAHTPEQLRLVPYSSSSCVSHEASSLYGSSPRSPPYSPPMGRSSVDELAGVMRGLQINKMKMNMASSWGSGYGSPNSTRAGFMSIPSAHIWEPPYAEEPEEDSAVEWVESGRELRERIYAKLGMENSLERVGRVDPDSGSGQDFGWVGELLS